MAQKSRFDSDEFRGAIGDRLKAVQQSFDDYQKADFPERTPQFFCLELCGEAGELANLQKKEWKGRDIADADLADEAADVLIALMNYSNARKLDLGAAVAAKLAVIEAKRAAMAARGETY